MKHDPLIKQRKIIHVDMDYLFSATSDEEDPTALINTKSYITTVPCFEDSKYTREYEKYASKSYYIDPFNFKAMLASIKEDKETCEKAQRGEYEYPRYQFVGFKHKFIKLSIP